MSDPPLRWSDAVRATERVRARPADRDLLLILTRLPFVSEPVIQRLVGLCGGASLYRRLVRLAEEGLVAAVRPPVRPGHGPGLWYLGDLGLAVVALDQEWDVADLARRSRLRRADLLARLPGLPQLLAAYELLGALAAAGPDRPDLLTWERPWRRRVWTPRAKAPRSVRFPAYAALAWNGETSAFILVPDLATAPLRFYRPAIRDLLALRAIGMPLPALAIATTHAERKAAWVELLEEVRRERGEVPLQSEVATWAEIRQGLVLHALLMREEQVSWRGLVRRITVRCSTPRRANAPLLHPVGPRLDASAPDGATDSRVVLLRLGEADRALLDFVGRHPFLSVDQVSVALGRDAIFVRKSVRQLIAVGFLRALERDEAGLVADRLQMVELTGAGLEIVAAQQGLSLAEAVRLNGLVGGGPAQPIGHRRKLLTELAHTRGADGVFVELIALTRTRASRGSDDALLEWRNAAACARSSVRPDGYGLYRQGGKVYGFFLEFDRGTMSVHGYLKKLAAYYDYWESDRFTRDYVGFPTILFVTTSYAAAQRFARAARLALIGRQGALPLLLTTQDRVHDESNPDGLLGQCWHAPDRAVADRQSWLRPGISLIDRHHRDDGGTTNKLIAHTLDLSGPATTEVGAIP